MMLTKFFYLLFVSVKNRLSVQRICAKETQIDSVRQHYKVSLIYIKFVLLIYRVFRLIHEFQTHLKNGLNYIGTEKCYISNMCFFYETPAY